jgi:hypothetical protein
VIKDPAPQVKEKAEELFGKPWPFPGGLCKECFEELSKDPEFQAKIDAFGKAAGAKVRAMIEKDLREGALKVLDFADRLAGKF